MMTETDAGDVETIEIDGTTTEELIRGALDIALDAHERGADVTVELDRFKAPNQVGPFAPEFRRAGPGTLALRTDRTDKNGEPIHVTASRFHGVQTHYGYTERKISAGLMGVTLTIQWPATEDADADADEGGEDDGERLMTDGGQDELTADVTEQFDSGHGLATPTAELGDVMDAVTVGDSVEVEYEKNGLTLTARGTVTDTTPEFGDVRFGGAYLHVNTSTGDYYFQDGGREEPADGYALNTITVRAGGE